MGGHIRALLLPSDRSPPHLIAIKTIRLEPGAPNSELGHHPDLRKYWGMQGWERRGAMGFVVGEGDEGEGGSEKLRGKYWLWRSGASGWLVGNQWVGGEVSGCF